MGCDKPALGCAIRHFDLIRFDQMSQRSKFDDEQVIVYDQNAGWSSLVARWAHNPKVGGSNPPPATKSY